MKRVPLVVGIATLYVLFYHASPFMGVPTSVIMSLFVMSPFVVVYMAYSILKYGKPSGFTFDEKFYDDLDYHRNGREQPGDPGDTASEISIND